MAAAAALLADGASGTRFEAWSRDVHAFADELDADGGHTPDDDPTRNRLSKAVTIDDTHVLNAQLHGLDGEIVFQTIDAIADELFRRHRNDENLPPGDLRTPREPPSRHSPWSRCLDAHGPSTSTRRGRLFPRSRSSSRPANRPA